MSAKLRGRAIGFARTVAQRLLADQLSSINDRMDELSAQMTHVHDVSALAANTSVEIALLQRRVTAQEAALEALKSRLS
jgi:hypothetical protein